MKTKIVTVAIAILSLIFVCATEAQQPAKVFRIGILSARAGLEPRDEVLRQRLRELGYAEGKNLTIEWRFWDNKPDLLNQYATELVRLKVDVIHGNNTATIQAAKKVTTTIPIVMTAATDPVESGLVASEERPGGNITGLTSASASSALYQKRLELLKEVIPQLSRLGVLMDPSYITLTGRNESFKAVQAVAGSLGLNVQSLEVRGANDFESAFQAATKAGSQAVIHLGHPLISNNRRQVADAALKNRMPVLYADTQFTDAGGLMSFGAEPLDLMRRAVDYIDKILKGAKPADMPIGQPTKFELVINAKVAQQIGLTIPQSVLYRADRVIR